MKRLRVAWNNMKQRCYNPNAHNYRYYGYRGIKVCDEWLNSFEAFETWALANGYDDTLTLDRKDNNGNYEPNNCRWATRKEQQNNRNNYNVVRDGKTHTVREMFDKRL